MTLIEQYLPALLRFLPSLAILFIIVAALKVLSGFAGKRRRDADYKRTLIPQFLLVTTAAVGLLLIILAMPLTDAIRGQILGLLGVVFTGVIALASTTFVTNALAGLMLRLIKNYKAGDFIQVNESFGRITERGLFHTEIQTAERNLTTFPNLYLVTNPMTVLRSSGTIISASLSLGYDVGHQIVETNLLKAATKAGLNEPFVQVMELGDYSITYKISAFLPETKKLLAARSNLKRCVLDELHGAGVEIVSPNFMNQRVLAADLSVIPEKTTQEPQNPAKKSQLPETVIFDKAETAEEMDQLRLKLSELQQQLDEVKPKKDAAGLKDREQIEKAIGRIMNKIEKHEQLLKEDGEIKKV